MSVLPRQELSKPLAVISKTNQGGLIIVMTALALILIFVSFLIRLYIRFKHGPWKRDDDAFVVASVSPIPILTRQTMWLKGETDLRSCSSYRYFQRRPLWSGKS